LQCCKEPLCSLVPRFQWRVVPLLLSLRHRERPIDQIAQVSKNLPRRARFL
jgi:hypothetical protein